MRRHGKRCSSERAPRGWSSWAAALLAVLVLCAPASAQDADIPCVKKPLDQRPYTLNTLLDGAGEVAKGNLPGSRFLQVLEACGVGFEWSSQVEERLTAVRLDPRYIDAIRQQANAYAAWQAATRVNTTDAYAKVVEAFPNSPWAAASAARVRPSRAEKLQGPPRFAVDTDDGTHIALLHCWRDGDLIRLSYSVSARRAGDFGYQAHLSEAADQRVGFDDVGNTLRREAAHLVHVSGEVRQSLAAGSGETFHLEMALSGADPKARQITLFILPFTRHLSAYSSRFGSGGNTGSWRVPIEFGPPSRKMDASAPALTPDAGGTPLFSETCGGDSSPQPAMGRRAPVAGWGGRRQPRSVPQYRNPPPGQGSPRSCTMDYFLGLEWQAAGRQPGYVAGRRGDLQRIEVSLHRVSRTTAGRVQFLVAFTNESRGTQLLWQGIPRSGAGGFDDRGNRFGLQWTGLYNLRQQPSSEVWLEPGQTAYALFETSGIARNARSVTIQSLPLLLGPFEARVPIEAGGVGR